MNPFANLRQSARIRRISVVNPSAHPLRTLANSRELSLANSRELSRTLANLSRICRESVREPLVNPSANPPYILVYPRELFVNPRESAVRESVRLSMDGICYTSVQYLYSPSAEGSWHCVTAASTSTNRERVVDESGGYLCACSVRVPVGAMVRCNGLPCRQIDAVYERRACVAIILGG